VVNGVLYAVGGETPTSTVNTVEAYDPYEEHLDD
jgi:Kelch motif